MSDDQTVESAKQRIDELHEEPGLKWTRPEDFGNLSYEQLLAMGRGWRDRDFAMLVVSVVAVAAETHPEILRTALAKVFDTSGIEDTTNRIMLLTADARADAMDALRVAKEAAHEAMRKIEAMHGEIDGLRMRASKAQSFMDNLAKRVAKAEAHMSKQPLFGKGKGNENHK